jgi:hypothetical protein
MNTQSNYPTSEQLANYMHRAHVERSNAFWSLIEALFGPSR